MSFNNSTTSGSCVINIWFIGLAAWLTATWAILFAVAFAAVGSASVPFQLDEYTGYMFSFCRHNPAYYGRPSSTICHPLSADNKDLFNGLITNVQYSEVQAAQAFYIIAIVTLSVSVVLAWLLAFIPQSGPAKITGVVLSGLCGFTLICVIISLGTATHVFSQAKSQIDEYLVVTSPSYYQPGTTQPPITTSTSVSVSAALPLLGIMILFSLLSTTLSVFVAIIKPAQQAVGGQRI